MANGHASRIMRRNCFALISLATIMTLNAAVAQDSSYAGQQIRVVVASGPAVLRYVRETVCSIHG